MGIASNLFFQYVEDFFNYRQAVYESSPQTIKSNRVDLGLFEDFIGSQDVRSIDGPAIIDFQYYLKKERQNCGSSINRKIFTLRSYGNYLKLYDAPGADELPFYDVLKIRNGYRKRPGALTPAQINLLFKEIDCRIILGIRDYAVCALMYQLGLRVGEVHSLNLENIDFESNTIHVTGKGNKPRTLHVNNELVEILSQYLAVRDRFYNSWLTQALFISKKGCRLSIRTMEDNFKKIVNYSSVHAQFNITCHTLRHSMASHLNNNNVDVLVIQSILGHASTRSTEPYIHPSLEKIRKAMEKLPGVKYVKELIRKGELDLRFQKRSKPKRE